MRTRHPRHRIASTRRRAAHTALWGAVAIATATAAGAGVAAADPTPGTTSPDCPRWTALLVPGTYEAPSATGSGGPVGVLPQVADSLSTRYGTDIEVRTLTPTTDATRPSTASPGEPVLTAALSALCAQTRVVLAGQAEGAAAVGDLAAAIGNNHGPLPASRVVVVGLVSDPHRDPSTPQLGNPVAGHGVAGPRPQDFGELTGRVRTMCPAQDPYCSNTAQGSTALDAVVRALTATPAPGSTSVQGPTTTTTPAITSAQTGALTPAQVLTQVVTVVHGLAAFAANVPAIVTGLAELPALLARGDVPGLHRVAGDLNNQFHPLVAMAADIDLHLVARALALAAPLDTTGVAAIASEVVGLLANLDVTRIAEGVGRAQEIAWTAAEILVAGDPLGAALALSGMAPIAADLLAATASAFTGTQLPSLAQTYTATTHATTGTTPGDPTRTDSDTAAPTGHDTDTTAALLANWLTQTINATR